MSERDNSTTAPSSQTMGAGEAGGWSSEEYARGYEDGVKENAADRAWMTDKAWMDAVVMLVHHTENAERTWLVGHEEHARRRDEWWARCKALAATRRAEDIATQTTVTDFATRLFDLHGFMLLETYRDKPAVTVTFPDLKQAQQFHNTLVELSQHRSTDQAPAERKLNLGITKEWFERRAKAEADLEIGAGFSVVNVTDADIAQMEVLAERALPKWAQDELARLRAALAATSEGGQ